MRIWVDADACPVAVKSILFKAAERTGLPLTLVSNQLLQVPAAENIQTLQVPAGFDLADQEIVRQLQPGDLVITADIPLAADALKAGAQVLDPRGQLLTENNIASRLQLRNMLDQLRSTGTETGGPPPFKAKDRQAFANQLDQLLSRYLRAQSG